MQSIMHGKNLKFHFISPLEKQMYKIITPKHVTGFTIYAFDDIIKNPFTIIHLPEFFLNDALNI